MRSSLHSIAYRLWQVRQQLGFVAPLSTEEYSQVAQWLPALPCLYFELCQMLIKGIPSECVRACWSEVVLIEIYLQQHYCMMLVRPRGACLSGHGRQLSWENYVFRIFLRCLAVYPYEGAKIPAWRRSLSNAWWHAEIGANLASGAGLSQAAVLYIRTHHQPDGPAAELYLVDEVV